ncbi:hypothetical protein PIB30_044920, partial [Stylosanthes scabra]|nr:hypothetical protein [Stylosanthes scabra]
MTLQSHPFLHLQYTSSDSKNYSGRIMKLKWRSVYTGPSTLSQSVGLAKAET